LVLTIHAEISLGRIGSKFWAGILKGRVGNIHRKDEAQVYSRQIDAKVVSAAALLGEVIPIWIVREGEFGFINPDFKAYIRRKTGVSQLGENGFKPGENEVEFREVLIGYRIKNGNSYGWVQRSSEGSTIPKKGELCQKGVSFDVLNGEITSGDMIRTKLAEKGHQE
jgi:hypothetical protein